MTITPSNQTNQIMLNYDDNINSYSHHNNKKR